MTILATVYQSTTSDILVMIESNPKLQATTKAQYRKAITNYLATGQRLTDVDALTIHAATLSKSSRAFLKAAVRLWGEDVAQKAKAGATPETVAAVQATVFRIEALNEAIRVPATKGVKAHSWLTQSEVKQLLDMCNIKTIQGQRDRVILGLLVGAGLRREELVNLTFGDVVILSADGKARTVLNIRGKGSKDRPVPISDRLATALDAWGALVGSSGYITRSISKGGAIGESISAIGIFEIVAKVGAIIGKPKLAPHDLRRTYAQLGYEAGVPITQISKLLGHANMATTQRYLNLDLDLSTTVSDFIPF
jgi:integrase